MEEAAGRSGIVEELFTGQFELLQFAFVEKAFHEATIQTDQELRECQDWRLRRIRLSLDMQTDLRERFHLALRSALHAGHTFPRSCVQTPCLF